MEAVLAVITTICGIFLFAAMGTENSDEARVDLLVRIGSTGAVAVCFVFTAEVATAVHAFQKHQNVQQQQGSGVEDEEQEGEKEEGVQEEQPAAEAAWVYIIVAVGLALYYLAATSAFMLTLDNIWEIQAHISAPLVAISFILAMMMKPRRNSKLYRFFIFTHMSLFAVLGELTIAIGMFRRDNGTSFGVAAIMRIVIFWLPIFYILMQVRRRIAALPDNELSDFLCQTIIARGTASIAPIIFFSFETVTCLAEVDFKDKHNFCKNTGLSR